MKGNVQLTQRQFEESGFVLRRRAGSSMFVPMLRIALTASGPVL
jgi:hypothetical protein